MNKHKIKGICASLLLASSVAQADVLDFEDFGMTDFQHGTVVNSQYSGVTISAVNSSLGPDLAVAFDSDRDNTRDSDLEAPFTSNNASLPGVFNPGNILIIQENNWGCSDGVCNYPDDEGSRPAGHISFAFAQAIELISIDFFDIEHAENGRLDHNRIELYNGAGDEVFIDQYFTLDTGGDRLWDQLVFDTVDKGLLDIARIDVYFGGSGALDNLVYNNIPEVPVPAAIWLFGSALIGFIGYSRRRIV